MSLSIGITGGIGSGKSTVCRIFKLLGVPVFEADIAARSLMNSNHLIRNGLTELFGADIYFADNKLNRDLLAGFIFNNNDLLDKVNQLVHPVVRNEFINWKNLQQNEYVIHEAAILFESGFYKMMDFTILVTAPEEIRIERVTKRDGINRELIISRIKNQWTDKEKRKLANFELVNDNRNLIIPQIIQIDKNLKTYGKIW